MYRDEEIQLHYHKGEGHLLNGQFNEAIIEFNKVIELDPKHRLAWSNLINAYSGNGDLEVMKIAQKAYDSGLIEEWEWCNVFGWGCRHLKDYKKSIGFYKRAIALKPDQFTLYLNLGNVYYDAGSLKEAVEYYQKALKVYPQYEKAKEYLAKTLEEIGPIKLTGDMMYTESEPDKSIGLMEEEPVPGDIASIKDRLKRAFQLMVRRGEIKETVESRRILLFGPRHCGKRTAIKRLADELHVEFISVPCRDLINSPEEYITSFLEDELFRKIKIDAPSILYFDELEYIAPEKTDSKNAMATLERMKRILNILWERGNILIVSYCNRPMHLNHSLVRWFDVRLFVPVPTEKDRDALFRFNLKDIDSVNELNYQNFAELSEGMNLTEINEICKDSISNLAQMKITGPVEVKISDSIIVSQIERKSRSTSIDQLKECLEFVKSYGERNR